MYVKPAPGEEPLSKYAEKVEVELHPTFHPSKIIYPANKPIALTRIGWGTFRIDIKIHWLKKYGGFSELYHDLQFSAKNSKVETCRLEVK